MTAAHSLFIETNLPILENLVPNRTVGKRFGKRKVDKERRKLWRRLSKVKRRILKASCVSKAAHLLQVQQKLENELKMIYNTQVWEEENMVVNNMKVNPKAFFAFGRSRQTSPPSARVAAMRSMQNKIAQQNFIKHFRSTLKLCLKCS